ncbi:hypothetical protein QF028_002706 [Neobacillus sp. B4I6]|uniref:hypothetical protein n=1 Tax=Neobacillus sp. B4I6 TaxID=3373925 RepID=UPI003D1C54E3
MLKTEKGWWKMPFDNSLINMQTPGRVYALCKLLLLDSYTQDKLMELLQPESPEKTQAKSVYKLALDGGLIQLGNDKKVKLQVPEKDVIEPKRFEQYIVHLAFDDTRFIFGRFTAWVMSRGEKVLNETKEELADQFFNQVSRNYTVNREFNSTNILGWLTWANYFGLGHTMNGVFVANPSRRIQSVVENDNDLPRGEFIPFKKFMNWLAIKCPELDGGKLNQEFNNQFLSTQQLSFALSLGLRTLHDLNVITLKYTRDVEDIWYLQDISTHEIANQVTEIMVKG